MDDEKNFVEKLNDPLIIFLSKIVDYFVKFLSILMVLVIFWSLIDVVTHVYIQFSAYTTDIFTSETLFSTLGSFLTVLIAIEIYLNIIFYLKKDVVNVPLVLATALTAISRKVIIIDYGSITTNHMYAMASLIIAVGITYWLVTKNDCRDMVK